MRPADMDLKLLGSDPDGRWSVDTVTCSACGRLAISLKRRDAAFDVVEVVASYPPGEGSPPSADIPEGWARDYAEARFILVDDPSASAALSRRCLSCLLRERWGAAPDDFLAQVTEAAEQGLTEVRPEPAAQALLEALRAAEEAFTRQPHPNPMDQETLQAQAYLIALEGLLDACFAQPARLARRRAALENLTSATRAIPAQG